MVLNHICWSPSRRVYAASTDAGVFFVPPVMGGWARRVVAAEDVSDCQAVSDPAGLAQFLGMLGGPTARPGLGGCGCKGRRQ